MDKIWIKCIYHTLGMNNDVSNHIINSDDRWNDVHCNRDYNIYMQPNYYIIHYSFDIINNPQKKGHIVRWNNVISNPFIDDEHKEKLWNIYFESRKKYNVLSVSRYSVSIIAFFFIILIMLFSPENSKTSRK